MIHIFVHILEHDQVLLKKKKKKESDQLLLSTTGSSIFCGLVMLPKILSTLIHFNGIKMNK